LATPRMPSVPNSRDIRAQPPDGDGAAAPAGVTVTFTVAGLAATSAVPVGRFALTGTSWTPGFSPATSSVATSVDADNRSRSAIDPPMVMRTRSTDSAYASSAFSPSSWRPALNVRVPVTGRIWMVTLTGSSFTAPTPVGSASLTCTVSSADTPDIEMGSVSTWLSSASWSASPATSTTSGVTLTDSISNPAAGLPVMIGFTGSVRLWRSEKTGMTTRAVGGVTSTGLTAFPSLSTATSCASSSTSIPVDWMVTSARTESTFDTIDWAPVMVTVSGSTVVGPSVSPSGTGPWTTSTRTSSEVSSSSSTVATGGS